MDENATNLTVLLHRAAEGDAAANEDLFKQIYPTLHHLAHGQLKRHQQGTICTTDLVHEASLKLFGADKLARLEGREHLLATAARAMRHILIDYARARSAQQRGGDWQRVSLDHSELVAAQLTEQILALENALERLSAADPKSYQVAELKFFGGCTIEEIAAYLDVSDMTVKRAWRKARAFLYSEMEGA